MQQTHQKTQLFLFFFFYGLSVTGYGQDTVLCSTPDISHHEFEALPWYANNRYLFDFLDECNYFATKEQPDKILYRVPVKFHVYRNDKGQGGLSLEAIKTHLNALNHFHISNKTGFLFYLFPEIRYIDNTKTMQVNYYTEAPRLSMAGFQNGAVNVHVSDKIVKMKQNGREVTTTGVYNAATRTVFITTVCDKSTLTHEIGHYFGLLHPHRNWDKGPCKQEAVSRTREFSGCPFSSGLICEKSGDGLCDTPAEPNLSGFVNDDCKFVGAGKKDNWGDVYKPNTDNIMSYTKPRWCRNQFTLGQIAVMLYHAQKYDVCEWATKCYAGQNYKRQYIFDRHEPDDYPEMANLLEKGIEQKHTFHLVFDGEKKSNIDNDSDWFFFELQKNRSVLLEIKSGIYTHANMEVSLYSSNKKKLKTWDIENKQDIMAIEETLGAGKYYLKITKQEQTPAPDIADYTITLN